MCVGTEPIYIYPRMRRRGIILLWLFPDEAESITTNPLVHARQRQSREYPIGREGKLAERHERENIGGIRYIRARTVVKIENESERERPWFIFNPTAEKVIPLA